jgi:hypothetical protein
MNIDFQEFLKRRGAVEVAPGVTVVPPKPRLRVIVRNGYTDFFQVKTFLSGGEYLVQVGRLWHAWWSEPWPYKGRPLTLERG